MAKPGHGRLAHQLVDQCPSFAAYVVSFLTIGIIWVNHHTLLKNVSEIDRTLLFLNLLLLLFVVTIPFATATIAVYLTHGGSDASLAAALYQGVFEGTSLSFAALLWWSIRHEHMKIALTPASARSAIIRFGVGNVAHLAAVAIAFVSGPLSLLISGIAAAYYLFEQTPAHDTAPPASDQRP